MTVDTDPSFYLKFLDVYLGEPSVDEESYTERTWSSDKFKPQECRLRDNNYSAQAAPRASSFLLALRTPAEHH